MLKWCCCFFLHLLWREPDWPSISFNLPFTSLLAFFLLIREGDGEGNHTFNLALFSCWISGTILLTRFREGEGGRHDRTIAVCFPFIVLLVPFPVFWSVIWLLENQVVPKHGRKRVWGNGVPFQLPTDLVLFWKKKVETVEQISRKSSRKLRCKYRFNVVQCFGFLCTGQMQNGSWQMVRNNEWNNRKVWAVICMTRQS